MNLNKTLHILSSTTIPSTFASLDATDSIILIRDAVYLLLEDGPAGLPAAAIYVLADDLAARGLILNTDQTNIQVIDYTRFVELTIVHPNSVTW